MIPIFTHQLDVRFRDCDPMGHVNNAVYLTYLEQARFSQWGALWGFGEQPVPGNRKPGVILARVEIDYRKPARYGDRLEIRIALAGIGRSSFTYEYEVAGTDGAVVAVARSVQVMYDYGLGHPVPVPDDIRT
ncbi:MAG: acyl-CoA thioesterase, partial [Acidobacteria bacterium]|nr:acyl-CoA thioesterase [Acidobacteriota bacterium]